MNRLHRCAVFCLSFYDYNLTPIETKIIRVPSGKSIGLHRLHLKLKDFITWHMREANQLCTIDNNRWSTNKNDISVSRLNISGDGICVFIVKITKLEKRNCSEINNSFTGWTNSRTHALSTSNCRHFVQENSTVSVHIFK